MFKWFKRWSALANETFVSIEWLDHDAIITTTCNEYRGSCTVWHDALTGKRAGTFKESWLCDIWTLEKWRRE